MAVHQLISTFSLGDAMGQSAVHFALLLRRLGVHGEIYAGEVPRGLASLVKPAAALRPAPDDLVLYHHGIASAQSGRLLHLPCRRGVVFHNITPARLYSGQPLEEALIAGRAQLAAMAPSTDLAIGVSDFNSAELRAAGFPTVHTVPLFVEPERFRAEHADAAMAKRLANPDGLTVVSVSRVAPHKRFEDLLALHRELLRIEPRARLVLAGGYDAGSAYFKSLARTAAELGGVDFLGRVSHAELVATYRAGTVFVSMSEHEGFGVPLLEAMASEVPVLAYAAAAVPETLGGAGIGFTAKPFAALAELVREVARDAGLRKRLLRGQARRLEELSADAAKNRLAVALSALPGTLPARAKPAPPRRKQRSRATAARKSSTPRLGLIVQRYGDVSGGSEKHAEAIAHRLSPHFDVTVLTTCAKDHLTWANEFPEGPDRDGPVKVLRFPTVRSREIRAFNRLSRQVLGRAVDRVREEHWVAEQGPLAPGLLRHLSEHGADYDAFLAFTYLYAPAAWGVPMVGRRALVIPTAHDEDPFRFELYADVFEAPRALLCNTPEEAALIDRRFPRHAPIEVVGVGVETPKASGARFRKKHGLTDPYLFYVGRVEAGKGIPELLAHHAALVRGFHDAPELILAGTASMDVRGPRVRHLGRISDQDKHDAIAGALAVVVPSRYESLSLLALEAFAQGTPVLANGLSEVLTGQLQRSGGGHAYLDAESFAEGVRQIGDQRALLSRRGRAFARRHTWAKVITTYRRQLAPILEGTP